MNRKSICALICLSVAGCLEPETYEFDFGQEPGFEWDGKVRVTKRPEWHLGPFLIIDQYWTVDRIEFGSRDGRIAIVDTRGSGAGATVDPNLPTSHPITGVIVYRDVIGPIIKPLFVSAGRSVKGLAGGVYRTATQPVGADLVQAAGEKGAILKVPVELRPYAEHVDELSQADWCAIALERGNEMTVEFRVPEENLRILIHGSPRKYEPGVLEVWSDDGRLLKRFDPKQGADKKAGEATTQSQPTSSRRR